MDRLREITGVKTGIYSRTGPIQWQNNGEKKKNVIQYLLPKLMCPGSTDEK